MGLDRKIKIYRKDRKIEDIYLLCSFYMDDFDAGYIVYVKDDTSVSDNNIVYFGKLRFDDEKYYLVSIGDQRELDYVKKTIKELFRYSAELEEIKKNKIAFNKKLEIPKNIFENPYNDKYNDKKDIDRYDDNDDKSRDNREYRNRLKSLAEDIRDIKPIDKEVPDTLYVNYYNEMGMLLKSKLSTLKQLWVEYQLMYNEKQLKEEKDDEIEVEEDRIGEIENSFPEYPTRNINANFDDLLDSLSNRIEYINNYLDELRKLKNDMSKNDYKKLDDDKEKLKKERKEFEEYKKQEEDKLRNEKKELQIHFNKFQSIVDSFDKKIKEVK